MRALRAPVVVLLLFVAAAAIDYALYLRLMPDRVATHFSGAGLPNGWMSRRQLALFDVGLLGFLLLLLIGLGLLGRFLPPTLINVPHRDYWFAPERRRESADRLFRHVLWLCCLLV